MCNTKFSKTKGEEWSKETYETMFYRKVGEKRQQARKALDGKSCHNEKGKKDIYGFPLTRGAWCTSHLKSNMLNDVAKGNISRFVLPSDREKYKKQGENMGFSISERSVVQYLGIAADETVRIERHKGKTGIKMPLVEIGWTEADCKQWCIDNDLLSPIYTDTCMRGGCWFCHNQGVNQLRELRHNYPDLWELLLKWDKDSPITFHADGHTVHDFDERFKAEDEGFIDANQRFHWNDLDMKQYNIFHYFNEDGTMKDG